MGECKTKAIQTNLGTFRHNQTYPGIIQAYSGIFRTLCYPGIFKTVVCPEPWHFQNQNSEPYSEPRHIHNSGTFRTPLHSERWHIQNLRHIQNPVGHIYDEALIIFTALIIFINYNYFRKACLVEISILR